MKKRSDQLLRKILAAFLCIVLLPYSNTVFADVSSSQDNDTVNVQLIRGEEYTLSSTDNHYSSELEVSDSYAQLAETEAEWFFGDEQFELTLIDEYDLDEVQNPPTPLDSGEPVYTTSAVAAVADLVISEVRINQVKPPFPTNANVNFLFALENRGTASAENIPVRIYLDNAVYGNLRVAQVIEPKKGYYFGFTCKSATSGNHQVKAHANPGSTIQESDYSNNQAAATFAWFDWPDLVAHSITCDDSENNLIVMKNESIVFGIANAGSMTATNVDFYIYADAGNGLTYVGNDRIDSIAPGRGVYYTWVTAFQNEIPQYKLRLEVIPGNNNDLFLNNNIKEETFSVHHDLALFAGKWRNSSNINVGICSDSLSKMNMTAAQIKSALQQWNGISNITLSDFSTYDEDSSKYKCTIFLTEFVNNAYGRTALYSTDGGQEKAIHSSAVYTDDSTYTRAELFFNVDTFNNESLAYKEYAIAHEGGHMLGLAHPFETMPENECNCSAPSIMNYHDNGNMSFTVVSHDKYNVKHKYG